MSPEVIFALIIAGSDPAPLHFSTKIDFTATTGPNNGQLLTQGDELCTDGFLVNVWIDLIAHFCPKPAFPNFGLDSLHRRGDGIILFSTEFGWFDECLAVQISGGDLLRIDPGTAALGSVERTNLELLEAFVLKPVPTDVGLDAVAELPGGELYFSIERDDFSTALGVTIHHGDLLSDQGVVVRTNAQLLKSFCIKPVVADLGLDALVVPGNGEIWFSTEEGFFDECLGAQVGDGDLLSDAGYVVATNEQLLAEFISEGAQDRPGLDAAWSNLIAECAADLNLDCEVDVLDLLIVLATWGPCTGGPCLGDINGDGAVDVLDLLILLAQWGPCPSCSTTQSTHHAAWRW